MPRIKLDEKQGETNFQKALAYVPEVAALYDALYEQLWNEEEISLDVKEKVRLYLANKNGCATCMSLSYTGGMEHNEAIAYAVEHSDFSGFADWDRKLFIFLETYRSNPRLLKDSDLEWLKIYYEEKEIMKLLAFINLFDGYHKMIVSLDLYDFCSLGKEGA
jgi:exopolyphosphatase/pppGpp-phosphohydrolase